MANKNITPEVGQTFFDSGINEGGVILDVDDLENVVVEFDMGGQSYYCLDEESPNYDKAVILIKTL